MTDNNRIRASDERPLRPSVPSYTEAERALIADAFAAGEDVYDREVIFHRDGSRETRPAPDDQVFRLSRDPTDAPTSPAASVTWGHIIISSAKAQHDELETAVSALECLPHADWRTVRSVSCKHAEYSVDFPTETSTETAREIARDFARSVFRIGGGYNHVCAEIAGETVLILGPRWSGDELENPAVE